VRASFAPTHVLALARLATDQSTDCALDGATGYPLPAFPPSAVIDDTRLVLLRVCLEVAQMATHHRGRSLLVWHRFSGAVKQPQMTIIKPAHRKTPFGGHIERLIGS
jgi:hypothetical protein